MDLSEGIQAALNGNALLFVGAGFSLGAKDLDGNEFSKGSELAKMLCTASGLTDALPIEDASEIYLEHFGYEGLISFIRSHFTASEIRDYHLAVANIPWRRIYTTNYDDVLEKAYATNKRKLTSITLDADIYKTPKDKTLCIHLNGSISRLDRDTIFSELKLTETSYLTSSIETSPWIHDFRYEIELAQAVFFLGFSMYDLDIRRILVDSTKLWEKSFFALGDSPDRATILRVSRFGQAHSITTRSFTEMVSEEARTFIPIEKSDFVPIALTEYIPTHEAKPIEDKDFLDFLLFGKYQQSQILESVKRNKEFFLERHEIDGIYELVNAGVNTFSLDSDFGNGKSLFLEGIRIKFQENGYRVFDVNEASDYTKKELDLVAGIEDKSVVIFERYARWFSEIESFCMRTKGDKILILTERSSSHDVLLDTLSEKIGERKLSEVNLNSLTHDETEWFLKVFENYGFWGDLAGESLHRKRAFLQEKCRGQISSILLSLFESPQIKEKLHSVIDEVKSNNTHFDLLISIFILTVMGNRPSLNLLGDIWGAEIINRTGFRRDVAVQQFINFDSNQIDLRSPVVSEYFLRNLAETSKIVSVLITIAKATSKLSHLKRYKELFKDLMRFRYVQAVLPEKGLRKGAIDYYENIKNLPECKSYPLFWLQYAIACTTTTEVTRARKYFETAYSLAKDRGWDVYQIDNHYARFLLVEAMEILQVNKAMDNFRNSHAINRRQINSVDRKRYPFRVASIYRQFFDKFEKDFTPAHIGELNLAFEFILKKIVELPSNQQESEPMKSCKKDMQVLIAHIETLQ